MVEKNYITVNHKLLMIRRQLDSARPTVSHHVSTSVQELHEGLCLKVALCWALMLGFLYSSHLPIMAGLNIDIRNIIASINSHTSGFSSAALFLCQCEIPFEFQMKHKQPIISVLRIELLLFFTLVWQRFYVWRLFYQLLMKAPVCYSPPSKPSASDPMGLPLQTANVSSYVKHS